VPKATTPVSPDVDAAPALLVHTEASEIENLAVNNNRRMERNATKAMVAKPFGKLVPADTYADYRYDHTQNAHLDTPETLLKDPKPGYHYAWPAVKGGRDDTYAQRFQARKSMGIYLPVDKNRLKADHGAPITTHEGNDDTGIYWYMHQLVEIPPKAWQEHFVNRQLAGMAEMARREESHLEDVESTSQGLASGTLERYLSN
jgi:hypothetical protein